MSVDVLICVADGLIYEGLDYADRIEQRLTQAGLTCERSDLTDTTALRPSPALGYVYTGGQTSVHSEASWMRAAINSMREKIADAHNGGPAVVGVCLGSQLIAEALRPGSIIETSGIEVGLTPVRRAWGDAEHGDNDVQVVPSFHYQAITSRIEEIEGVKTEYSNEHTAVQALSYGERVFGCQFHPELGAEDLHMLIDYNKDVIAKWGADTDTAHLSVEQHRSALRDDLFSRMVIDRIKG